MKNVIGFIGFSNGAFFLNRLIQHIPLNKPVISIGGGGHFKKGASYQNDLYLLIGNKDKDNYKNVLLFFNRAKSQINTSLIIHNGGHEIPKNILETLIKMRFQKVGAHSHH